MAKIPIKIGKYDISAKIAEGGMGAVYKGLHPTLNREVILKKLTLSGDDHIIERFKREARIMMDFKNDNIVDVYDHFKAGGSYYIVLEYVNGMALDGLIKKERYLPNDTALLIFLESCKALKYAHDKNVIHRDIKPGNILISKLGEIKLVDFGIATITDDDESNLTRDGMTLGTPSYMAPEQFNNSKSVDLRADIYSMGVMLYEMVTGKKPYPANYSPETLARIQKGKYQSPRKHNPAINGFIVKLIHKCMKAKADKRFKDLGKVISLLEKYFKKKGKDFPRKILIAKITGENINIPKNKFAIWRKLSIAISAFFVALVFVFILFWSGFHHEIFESTSHGSLIVQIKVPKGSKEFKDFFLESFLYEDDNSEIPRLPDKMRYRIKDESDSLYILQSNKIYLPSGDYRLKMKFEDRLVWKSFFLNPISYTLEESGGSKVQILNLSTEKVSGRIFTVRAKAIDSSNDKDISNSTDILVWIDKRWSPVEKVKNRMLSGSVYKFRFKKKNYFDKNFSLRIDPEQSVLDLSTKIVPHCALVRISSPDSGFKLEINNSNTYLHGGEVSHYKELKNLSSKEQELSLLPGEYKFRFYGKGYEKELLLKVNHLTKMDLKISYDKNEKAMILEGLN